MRAGMEARASRKTARTAAHLVDHVVAAARVVEAGAALVDKEQVPLCPVDIGDEGLLCDAPCKQRQCPPSRESDGEAAALLDRLVVRGHDKVGELLRHLLLVLACQHRRVKRHPPATTETRMCPGMTLSTAKALGGQPPEHHVLVTT